MEAVVSKKKGTILEQVIVNGKNYIDNSKNRGLILIDEGSSEYTSFNSTGWNDGFVLDVLTSSSLENASRISFNSGKNFFISASVNFSRARSAICCISSLSIFIIEELSTPVR